MKWIRNTLSLLITLCMTFALAAPVSAQDNNTPAGHVTITVERFTLGQGFIREPINIPFYPGERISHITARYLGEAAAYSGTLDDAFYMTTIRDDADEATANAIQPPQYILDAAGTTAETYRFQGRMQQGYLSAFDYSFESGWMYHLNGQNPQKGASECTPQDGDVIRWQFTLYGTGRDLGDNSFSSDTAPIIITPADKDDLLRKLGAINAASNRAEILAQAGAQQAYDQAIAVLSDMTSAQNAVDAALAALPELAGNGGGHNSESALRQLDATLAHMLERNPNPVFGKEWEVMTLARSNYPTPEGYYEGYYASVVAKLQQTNGNLTPHTEYSRLILALSAIGRDARDVGGYNLLDKFSAPAALFAQGVNGGIYALIAMDTRGYEFPESGTANRDRIINAMLSYQLEDGSFELKYGESSSVDITAMAIQGLAPYSDRENVSSAIERALEWLAGEQKPSGGFATGEGETCESSAQVLLALLSMGIDPMDDARFMKNGNTLLDALMEYAVEDAGFAHKTGEGYDNMASYQAGYALTAYQRKLSGKSWLYDMSDVNNTNPGDPAEIEDGAAALILPEEISGSQGTEFNGLLKVGGWPEIDAKAMDAVFTIPEELEVVSVTPATALTGGSIDYNLLDGKLRISYLSYDLATASFAPGEFPAELFSITLRLKAAQSAQTVLTVSADSLRLLERSDQDAFEYDVSAAAASVSTVEQGEASVTSRVLYQGDGSDLIPADKQAVAFEFTNIADTPDIQFEGATLYHSPEISEKRGALTYVALLPAELENDQFSDVGNYDIGSGDAESIRFADTNKDNKVNAQDALNTLSAWLRKTDAPQDGDILVMNVNADPRIDTVDVLSILEAYISDMEFAVIGK